MTTVRTEAWWCCTRCGKPLTRIGKGFFYEHIIKHRSECTGSGIACGVMKQIEQKKRKGDVQ